MGGFGGRELPEALLSGLPGICSEGHGRRRLFKGLNLGASVAGGQLPGEGPAALSSNAEVEGAQLPSSLPPSLFYLPGACRVGGGRLTPPPGAHTP